MNFMLFLVLPMLAIGTTYLQRGSSLKSPAARLNRQLLLWYLGIYPVFLIAWTDQIYYQILFALLTVSYLLNHFFKRPWTWAASGLILTPAYYLLWPEVMSQKSLVSSTYIAIALVFYFGEGFRRVLSFEKKTIRAMNFIYLVLMYVVAQLTLEIGI